MFVKGVMTALEKGNVLIRGPPGNAKYVVAHYAARKTADRLGGKVILASGMHGPMAMRGGLIEAGKNDVVIIQKTEGLKKDEMTFLKESVDRGCAGRIIVVASTLHKNINALKDTLSGIENLKHLNLTGFSRQDHETLLSFLGFKPMQIASVTRAMGPSINWYPHPSDYVGREVKDADVKELLSTTPEGAHYTGRLGFSVATGVAMMMRGGHEGMVRSLLRKLAESKTEPDLDRVASKLNEPERAVLVSYGLAAIDPSVHDAEPVMPELTLKILRQIAQILDIENMHA